MPISEKRGFFYKLGGDRAPHNVAHEGSAGVVLKIFFITPYTFSGKSCIIRMWVKFT